jgi:ferric-dicitrate binding protein FerR (iron transport regulator)
MDEPQTQHTKDPPADTARLRAVLEQSAQTLDAATLSRLNRARQAALAAAAPSRRRWSGPLRWGIALAASAVLAVVVLPALQAPPVPAPTSSEDFAMIAADVEPALLEDLEFYAWLDSQTEEDAWEG